MPKDERLHFDPDFALESAIRHAKMASPGAQTVILPLDDAERILTALQLAEQKEAGEVDGLVERLLRTKKEYRVRAGFGGLISFNDESETREVPINPDGPEAAAALQAQAAEIASLKQQLQKEAVGTRTDEGGWQPIETAPRDGSVILAVLDGIDASTWAHLNGRVFAVRHEGRTKTGHDLGWSLFPGFGGAPDSWIGGWRPHPELPALKSSALSKEPPVEGVDLGEGQ